MFERLKFMLGIKPKPRNIKIKIGDQELEFTQECTAVNKGQYIHKYTPVIKPRKVQLKGHIKALGGTKVKRRRRRR